MRLEAEVRASFVWGTRLSTSERILRTFFTGTRTLPKYHFHLTRKVPTFKIENRENSVYVSAVQVPSFARDGRTSVVLCVRSHRCRPRGADTPGPCSPEPTPLHPDEHSTGGARSRATAPSELGKACLAHTMSCRV
ncbi:hypothetical protein EVAR_19557_1 [Eumeta japonica]|uniref:Uncharacterized protein n=1 Tax=Eumeta variegata TaxID=151549 RepID=A0A4C1UG32_EUMVA|nr:hypothetical protein EVAR_19557_1 [Eumeta japonica]